MILKGVIIDDEPLAIDIIQGFAEKIPFLDIVSTFTNPLEAIAFLRDNEVDILFLDIQMPELTGIQLINSMNKKPLIVFTTAYEEYAIKGYELEVVDYLLKPFSFERFLQAVNKVMNRTAKSNPEQSVVMSQSNKSDESEFIFVKTEYRMQKIFLKDIFYIEAMKDYLRIVTNKEGIMTLLSFKKIEEKLPSDRFMRIHRSYLIALDKIEAIERNTVKILDEYIPISDTYKQHFYEIIDNRKIT